MGALVGFAPFIAFAVVENIFGIIPGLAAGLVVSLGLLVFDFMRGERHVNVLEIGSAIMFGLLTGLALTVKKDWTIWEVRLWVDCGLVLVVLLSIAVRRPFTLRHSHRMVSSEVARSPAFLKTNNILTAAWAAAFAGLAAIDFYMLTFPETPVRRGVILTLVVLAAAVKFTQSYTKRVHG